jgi:hypothetical protein
MPSLLSRTSPQIRDSFSAPLAQKRHEFSVERPFF